MDFMANLLADMRRTEPAERPSIDKAVEHWKRIRATLPSSQYRYRLSLKTEPAIERAINDTVAAAWNGIYQLRRLVH